MKRPDSSFPDSSSPHSTPAAARRPRERPPRARGFATTQWSLVLAAHPAEAEQQTAAREALDTLCRAYWYPLYAFARSRGHGPEEAQDLTQAFFARLLEKESLARADPERGRFRSFLLGAMKNFMANEWHRRRATKRGGGVIFTDPDALGASLSGVAAAERDPEARYGAAAGRRGTDPELEFDREWALTILDRAMTRLGETYRARGQESLFRELRGTLAGEEPDRQGLARRLKLSEGAVKVAIHRLRKRYGTLIRSEVSETVHRAEDVDREMRYLVEILRSPGHS